MTQSAPETIFNDLLERSVDALGRSDALSSFEFRRLEREIGSLAKVDASGALELRSHLAALQGDARGTDEYFEKAMRISTEPVSTVVRYMVVLGATARGDRLMEIFQRFKALLRNDPAAIRTITKVLAGAGWLRTSDEFAAEAKRLGAGAEGVVGAEALQLDAEAEQEIAAAVCFSHNFLRSRGTQPEAIETLVVPNDDGTPSLFYQFSVDRDPEVVADLEWDLFEALAGKGFPLQQRGLVVFGLAAGAVKHAH